MTQPTGKIPFGLWDEIKKKEEERVLEKVEQHRKLDRYEQWTFDDIMKRRRGDKDGKV